VGHTGTLDPMATGVLPICIGSAARITEYLDFDLKKYRAEMILGLSTETQDIWGEATADRREELKCRADITIDVIKTAAASLVGDIKQTPPKYSAIKVRGKKLYEYARAGEEVEIKSRKVFIKEISINGFDPDKHTVYFDVTCGKGTYIRAICNDIGEIIGCGAAMSSLIRLSSGAFTIEDAITFDELSQLSRHEIEKLMKPADYPLIYFGKAIIKNRETAFRFVNGGLVGFHEVDIEREPDYNQAYKIYANEGNEYVFLGVAFYKEDIKIFKVDKIFARSVS